MIYAIIFAAIVICQVIAYVLQRREALFPMERGSRIRFLYNYNDNRFENISFITLGCILILMAALRDGIGYDWHNYHHLFNTFEFHSYRSILFRLTMMAVEPGYAMLNILAPNFYVVVVVVALFSVPTKLWIINKYSDAKFISLLMYFAGIWIAYDMGIIRQGISISMFMIGLKYIHEQKFLKFMLTVFFGMMFHVSSFIYIPLYFINYRHFSRIKIYAIAAISLVIYFIDLSRVAIFLLELLPFDAITYRFMAYIEYDGGLILSLVKRIVVLVIFVEFYERFDIRDKMSRIFLNSYVLSIALMALFSSVPILGARGVIGLYFMQIFIFAKIFAVSNKLWLKMGVFALVIALSIDTMYTIILEANTTSLVDYIGNRHLTPYASIIHRWLIVYRGWTWLYHFIS